MTDRSLRRRIVGAALVIAAAWSGLGARLAWLHLYPHEDLRARMDIAREIRQELLVNRGRILDRNGVVLATDQRLYDLNINPEAAQRDGVVASLSACLAHVLGLPKEEILKRASRPNRRQEYLARGLDEAAAERVRQLKQGDYVWLDEVSTREYPQGIAACHVIGFSNSEGRGLAGIELGLNVNLRGVPGERVSLRDAKGREQRSLRITERPPEPGDTVELTIDLNLQRMVEAGLDEAMAEHRAEGAWAIIQDVRTGEILALAARPGFDLNAFGKAAEAEMMNRPIGYSYEPGSTFKAAVIASAFNEGIITPERIYDCENGTWMFHGRPLNDYHPYGRLSVADILKKSSNIGTAKIGLELGREKLEPYLRAFGFGSKTGIDLPGEESGFLARGARLDDLTLSRVAMGHSVMTTSLQVLNAFACLANDGVRMRPAIVKRVVNARNRVLEEFSPIVEARPIRPETAQLMMKLLCRVTEEGGTGRRAALDGYRVAGKTGTAEKVINGHYAKDQNVSSFVGVVPADRPRLAMIIVVDNPKTVPSTGGVIAAPIFARVAKEALPYLDIPPEGPVRVIVPNADEPSSGEEELYAAGITG